jgi:propanol-preferring alcohol dehydrogenase
MSAACSAPRPCCYTGCAGHASNGSAEANADDVSQCDAAAAIQKEVGGTHCVLVTAVSRSTSAQALGMVRRGGTVALNGLPPGDFPLPIFSTVLNGITVRGSIVGTRRDLQVSREFAAQSRVCARIHRDRLGNINHVFAN